MTYLIDASIFIFRAWFSVPDSMTCPNNHPVNAVYGYTRFLSDFLESVQPDSVAAAFDESLAESFRCEIYPAYKANREPAPEELKRQFAQCRAVTRSLGVTECSHSRFEADDLIGTMAGRAREAGRCVAILSRDKDLLQILQVGDMMWDTIGGRRIGHDDVPDLFLDELYENLDSVENVNVRGATKLGAKLEVHREQVYMCRELTRIRYDVPLPDQDEMLARRVPDLDELKALYDDIGFGQSLHRQAQRIADSY